MRIQYIGHRPREIAAPGRTITVAPDEVIDVGETLGRSLLAQPRRFRVAATVTAEPKPTTAKTKEPAER